MGIGRTPTFSAAALPLIVRSDTMPKIVALDLFLRRRSLAIIRTFVICFRFSYNELTKIKEVQK